MTLLVDTSVWSLAFRKGGPVPEPAVMRLATAINDGDDVVLVGAILQEILQAFRRARTLAEVTEALTAFPLLELDRGGYAYAAEIYRTCLSRGVSAGTIDCQIAAAAIRHDAEVLTTDRDFEHIAKHTPLRLALPPAS